MSTTPLVSCIMIFFNAETFIREAIQSILSQTYPEWELLLVDDGSSDRSTAIARGFADQYPDRVRYLEHDGHRNLGMSAARNLGIRHARGPYVAFLDSDDIWLRNKLREQVALLEAHPDAGAVYGPTEYWYSWTNKPEDRRRDFQGDIGVPPDTLVPPPELLRLALSNDGATMPGICSLLLRREAVAAVGGFETSFRGLYEDQAFLVKLFLEIPVFVTDRALDLYRQHPDSCCSRAIASGEYHPDRPHPARQIFLSWLAQYLSTQRVEDPAIWQALDVARKPYRRAYMQGLRRSLANLKRHAKAALRNTMALPIIRRLRAARGRYDYVPPVHWVRLGDLRRTRPISREYGYDRGRPIDRYYIEDFLARHARDIRGRVLEIGDSAYTRQFGADRVEVSDVLHVDESNPRATIVGDLSAAEHVPSGAFDCFILTQTLQLVYDVPAACQTAYRILKPGGVLLVTVPGITQISDNDWRDTWYWSFTTRSVRALLEEVFPKVEVEAHGNVLAATAFLHGLATEELRPEELDHSDQDYEVLITARAVKPEISPGDDMTGRWQYRSGESFAYGADTTYEKAIAFLDQPGATIEDWGCGTAYAKRFVTAGTYRGVDGSPAGSTAEVVDLRRYRSRADCILLRHVLEHNGDWRDILTNAVESFQRRMVLVIFTPFVERTQYVHVDRKAGIPTIAFRKDDLVELFRHLPYTEEHLTTATEYGVEHIFYFTRPGS
jgi:glycosyltransferase involved in cell wall biosynthesis